MTVSIIGVTPDLTTSPWSIGSYQHEVVCDVAGAVDMRFGNTEAEMLLSDWRPYAEKSKWLVRTGSGTRTVHCQFRDNTQAVIDTTTANVPADSTSFGPTFDAAKKYAVARAAMPPSSAARGNIDGVFWEQNFDDPNEAPHWSVYYYQPQHIFYPVTHSLTGGAEGGGFISADDSRWTIDTPETPDSVLAFLTYTRWHVPALFDVNIHQKDVSFYLRSRGADLKGATAYFWLFLQGWTGGGNPGRWYKTSVPLSIGTGEWGSKNTINIASYGDGWTKSFPVEITDYPMFDVVYSWGIGLRGFSEKPTGILDLSNFKIAAAV